MQKCANKETALRVRYCFTLSANFIPEAILEQDKELQQVVRKSDQCFAFVERQHSWNMYQIRIAATPYSLRNDERSYVIRVPFTALPVQMHGTTLTAEAIPDDLLCEDEELQSTVLRDGMCWMLVERQVDWDCYRVRIAARQSYLLDKERSHLIFVSAMQIQAQDDDDQEAPPHVEKAVPSDTETHIARERRETMKTYTIGVSEAELHSAMETMDPTEENSLVGKGQPRLKLKLQRWIDLMLFRAVLIALKFQEELQRKIRQVLVLRQRLGGKLIGIQEIYEEDHQRYWNVYVRVPVYWMS